MPQNHQHTPSHGSIHWAIILLAAVILWLAPWGTARAQQLSIDSPSVTEGDTGTATLTYTVSLSAASTETVTVDYADAGTGSATSGTDYEAISAGTLTFAPGETSKTIDVTVIGDILDEENETLFVRLSDPTNAQLASPPVPGQGTGTINDNDPAPRIRMLGNSYSESIADIPVLWYFPMEISFYSPHGSNYARESGKTITVSYEDTETGTATPGTDYTAIVPGTITIDPGEIIGQDLGVFRIIGDTLDEGDETIVIRLFNPVNATFSDGTTTETTATLTITNDDPEIRIADAAADEGDDVTFSVTLLGTPVQQTTVDYATSIAANDTAEATDFTTTSGTLTFAANTTTLTQTVTVPTTDDNVVEGNETFTATLSNPSHGEIRRATATGTIREQTPTIDLSMTPDRVAENDGATEVTVTATLNSTEGTFLTDTTISVRVFVGAQGWSPYANSTAVPDEFDLTIAAGETSDTGTFTLTPVDDVVDEADSTIRAFGTASNGLTVNTAELTLADDDAAPTGVTLAVNPTSVGEGAGATPVTVTATVEGGTRFSQDQTVTVTVAGSGVVGAVDFTAVPDEFDLTIEAGQPSGTGTFTLTPENDAVDESNETITVSGTVSSGVTVTPTTLRLTDNDVRSQSQLQSPPTVSLVLSPSSISENGGVSTVTATLSGSTNQNTTVTVSAAAQSPAVADDFTLSPNTTLTIAANTTTSTGTVTITGVNDDEKTGNKSVTVSGTVTGGNGAGAPANQTLIITDDDGAPSQVTTPRGAATDNDTAGITVTPTTRLTTTEAGGTADFTVVLDSQSTADVTIEVSSSNPEEGTVSPTSLTFTVSTWSTVQTVTVTGQDDDVDDGDQSYTIMLAAAVSTDTNYSGLDPDDVAVTNTDDDVPADRIVLRVAPASVAEEAGAQSVTVTAAFPQGSARLLTDTIVTLSVTGKTASAEDFAAVADFPVIIPRLAGSGTATFVLTPILDGLDGGRRNGDGQRRRRRLYGHGDRGDDC